MIGGRPCAVRTSIVFVVHSVTVPVGDGAAMIPGHSRHRRARVMFVIDPVMIAIRNRAAVIFRQPRLERAGILGVGNSILIRVPLPDWRRRPRTGEPDAKGTAKDRIMKSAGII